jgi:hypothetical protein
MPLEIVREYLSARVSYEGVKHQEREIWDTYSTRTFNASDYGPSQLTSTNTFLPPSYPQPASTDFDLDLESDTASGLFTDTPQIPTSAPLLHLPDPPTSTSYHDISQVPHFRGSQA